VRFPARITTEQHGILWSFTIVINTDRGECVGRAESASMDAAHDTALTKAKAQYHEKRTRRIMDTWVEL
jgi:hypothetical protein